MRKSIFVALLGLSMLSGCITAPTVPMVDNAESMKAKSFKAPKSDKAGMYVYRIK